MGIFAATVGLIATIMFAIIFASEIKFRIYITVFAGMSIFFTGMFVYDVTSPVTVETDNTIITNDYERYNLKIDSSKLGRVRKDVYTSDRPLAVINSRKEYVFMGFINNNH